MRNFKWLWVSLVVIVLDQLSKATAIAHLIPTNSKELLPILNFTLAFNQGAAFSFLDGAAGWQNGFFIGLATVISLVLIVWLAKLPSGERLQASGLALIIGGALGNVIDRIHYGYVVDFIDAHIAGYHWPIFNLADSAITIGVVLLLWSMFLEWKNKND